MTWSVFDSAKQTGHTAALAFLDPEGGVAIQRYDTMKYKQFDKLTVSSLGFFWRPEEVDLSKDGHDFKLLSDHEKHIFTANLKRQILLDSVQGRSPNLALLPIVSLPEIEGWIQTWAFSETIHSRSYTHIIRNIYADPSKIFDQMGDIQEIVDCATDISKHYDDLIELSGWYRMLGEGTFSIGGDCDPRLITVDRYEIKKALWLCINSVNILEGIRFYSSFACSWAYAETKRMEGNAKVIKLICRDENLHLAGTQLLLKLLLKDDPDYVRIAEETEDQCSQLFADAVDQEKAWASYLFSGGSLIGLNEELLGNYIEYIANKRMTAIGLAPLYRNVGSNPLPWTQKWIAGSDVQIAPQESEISSYISGGTKQDVTANTFDGFSL